MNKSSELCRQRLAAEHTSRQIQQRLEAGHRPDYLPDFIYGAIDGTVTTFAVVSGVAGADLSSSIVIVLGLANLVGDGFSMAASNYSGSRVERQLHAQARQREAHEIESYPEGEREEIRQIFANKGFQGPDLERAVDIITSDRERWIDTMITDEIGLSLTQRSPLKAATATMIAFLLIGFLPLFSFVTDAVFPGSIGSPYALSCGLTASAFFLVGAVKSRFVQQSWLGSGLETLALGGSAALLAYLVGFSLRSLV
ncbi:MAG: VIT1/CCC1 transporter family protein [Pirellulales bacterium]|nr:VIT1/CCC1 transporter family protein [Pirellulales bacterium]